MVSTAKKLDRVRDRAQFQAIPPDLDISKLISRCSNFHAVERVDARTITDETMEALRQLIQAHVIEGGKPLVLENWHQRSDWPRWIFNPDWLKKNHGTEAINVRDIPAQGDMPMSLKHYLNNLGVLASKFTPESYDGSQQRLYAKDIDCPAAWHQALQKVLPACTFYLSAADLMSSLPPAARAENLMCYFGHEGTYTPAHKEMCASLGQNIMVYTSSGANPGSSLWFMTASGDRDLVAEYWLGGLGHDIEVESHFASIEAFMEAPFPVYIVEQKLGDYILVPPLAPHQVWNRGEATMKVAWNRTTPETLELAISESLPKSRLVCRDEQYKNKAIIYETLKKYYDILSAGNSSQNRSPGISREKMKTDFRKLYNIFNIILLDEEFSFDLAEDMTVERIPNEFNVACSFCRGNIFNRFLSCKNCIPPADGGEEDDAYDVCLECYARGRSCACISKLCWMEQHDWQTLVRDHDKFRQMVIQIDGAISDESPLEFDTAFEYLGRKTLAWVCQEQLKRRPFVDIRKDPDLEDVDDEQEIKRKKKLGLLVNCHVCKIRHPSWRVAECSDCTKAYCFGNLWRAFDIDPFDALADHTWKCPVCLGICSCGQCRKNGKTRPYEPKGTMLGASTKHVADPRSVQSLVDFSRGNLGWLQSEHAGSLKRKRTSTSTDATNNGEGSWRDFDQSPILQQQPFGGYGGDDEEEEADYSFSEIPIDPSLGTDEAHSISDRNARAGSLDPDPNTGKNDVGGNGQYTSDDFSSVALAERERIPHSTASRHQAEAPVTVTPSNWDVTSSNIGVIGRVDGLMKDTEITGRPRVKQPLLPSPRDMLTGALPSSGRESPHDTHFYHLTQPDSYHLSLSGKSQSKTPRGEVQAYRRQPLAQDIGPDDQSPLLWPEMSSLEKDPAAFIAAAGLNMLSAGMGLQGSHEPSSSKPIVNQQSGASPNWPATAPAEDVGTYDGDLYQSPLQPVAVQPHMLVRDPIEPESGPQAPHIGQLSDEDYHLPQPPSQTVTTPATKRKSIAPSSDIYTSASSIIGLGSDIVMTEPTKPMQEMIVNDWAKRQKLAKTKVASLKGRGRNRKSLVVALKLGREGWKKWEEQKVEPDLVTKELVLGGGRVHKVLVGKAGSGDVTGGRSVSAATSAGVSEYASGSANGSAGSVKRPRGRPRKNPISVPMDVDQDDGGEDEDEDEPEVIPQPKERRRESAWMVRKREEEEKEEAANAIENERRAREKAIEDAEKARLKAIEDEKQRIMEEKQRIEDEEKARLQAIEDEKNRKEAEKRKAYQEAKRVAAKMAEGQFDGGWDYDSEEEYEEARYSEEEDQGMVMAEDEEVWEEREKLWWEWKLPGSHFAVAIERRPGYYWRAQYITEAELALRTGEPDETDISTPVPTIKTPEAKQPTESTRKIMRKLTGATAARGTAPATQSRRKSTGAVTAKRTSLQKSAGSDLDSGDDEYTASKWSLRKKQVEKIQTTEIGGPVESVKDGLRRRSTTTKYSDLDEAFDDRNNANWGGAEINDGEDMDEMEVEVDVEGENSDMEEGYDDRWNRGGRKWMW